MSNHEIKLDVSYTESEYLTAARLLTFQDSKTVFRILLTSAYLVGSVSILIGLLTDYPWWAGSIGTAFLTALFYNGLVRVPRKYFRGDPKFRDHYQFTFSDEGIAIKTTQLDSKLSWSLYTKVIEGSDQYLLVYGKGVRMMTVVPKRTFRDSLQENAFRELVTGHITSNSAAPQLKAKKEPPDEYKPTSLNPPDWR